MRQEGRLPEHRQGLSEGNDTIILSAEELKELEQATGEEAEVLYLQLMIRHHKAGVPMAEAARDSSGNRAVETLASSIIKSQTTEVETMTTMLEERGAEPLADGEGDEGGQGATVDGHALFSCWVATSAAVTSAASIGSRNATMMRCPASWPSGTAFSAAAAWFSTQLKA